MRKWTPLEVPNVYRSWFCIEPVRLDLRHCPTWEEFHLTVQSWVQSHQLSFPPLSLLTETNSPTLELSSFLWFPSLNRDQLSRSWTVLLPLVPWHSPDPTISPACLSLPCFGVSLPPNFNVHPVLQSRRVLFSLFSGPHFGELPPFATPSHGLCFSSLLAGGQLPFPLPPQTQSTTFPWKPGCLPLDCYYSCHLFIGRQDFFLFACSKPHIGLLAEFSLLALLA